MCVGEIDVCVYESVHSLANEWNRKMNVCVYYNHRTESSFVNVQERVCVIKC